MILRCFQCGENASTITPDGGSLFDPHVDEYKKRVRKEVITVQWRQRLRRQTGGWTIDGKDVSSSPYQARKFASAEIAGATICRFGERVK